MINEGDVGVYLHSIGEDQQWQMVTSDTVGTLNKMMARVNRDEWRCLIFWSLLTCLTFGSQLNQIYVIVFKYLRCQCHWGMKYQAPGVSIGRLIIIWGSGREGREGSIAPEATSKSK